MKKEMIDELFEKREICGGFVVKDGSEIVSKEFLILMTPEIATTLKATSTGMLVDENGNIIDEPFFALRQNENGNNEIIYSVATYTMAYLRHDCSEEIYKYFLKKFVETANKYQSI